MTQGRGDRDEWVTHYTLSHSQDAFRWSFINDPYGDKRVSFNVIATTGGWEELDKSLVFWLRINLLYYDDEISIKRWRNDERQRTHNLPQCQYVHPISYMVYLGTEHGPTHGQWSATKRRWNVCPQLRTWMRDVSSWCYSMKWASATLAKLLLCACRKDKILRRVLSPTGNLFYQCSLFPTYWIWFWFSRLR